MSTDYTERIVRLTVPPELVLDPAGFSLDCGGSVLKVVYRTKEDYNNAKDKKEGKLNLISFSRSELNDGVEYIRTHADIGRDGEGPTKLYATGIGGHQFQELFCKQLNVQLDIINEMDSFAHCFHYLSCHIARNDLLYRPDLAALDTSIKMAEITLKVVEATKDLSSAQFSSEGSFLDGYKETMYDETPWNSSEPLADTEEIFPAILAMVGSGMALMQVNKDKSFQVIDGGPRAGTAFLGLGRLLTGAKTFGELLELATKGKERNVHTYMQDLAAAAQGSAQEDGSNIYGSLGDSGYDNVFYFFGKVADASPEMMVEFSKEDIAKALMVYFIHDIAQTVQNAAERVGSKHVFFCGSLMDNPLSRWIMTQEMTRRLVDYCILTGKKTVEPAFHFLIPGPHLGALGAMLNSLEAFVHSRKGAAPAGDTQETQSEAEAQEGQGTNIQQDTHF